MTADQLAQYIRQIDGKHSMGAGAMAEKIVEWMASQSPAEGALTDEQALAFFDAFQNDRRLLGDLEAFKGIARDIFDAAHPQPKGIADSFRGARRRDAAEATLQRLGYRWHGAELWEPPLGQAPAPGAKPLAWLFEARHIDSAWMTGVSLQHPGAEGVYLRNVTPLYASQPPAVGADDAKDAARFRWLIDDKNADETNDTPMVCTSEDVHWGDKARALIDLHMAAREATP